MKKIFTLTIVTLFILLAILQTGVTSCTKETIKYDTVTVVHKDTLFVVPKDTLPIVFAGRDTTIQLRSNKDSIELKGSASDAHGTIISYLWSQVSGPNSALILNPGSDSTFVTNLIAGKYTFQLMAIDDDGEASVKTVSVTTLAPASSTITLQPSNNPYEVMLAAYNSGGDLTNPHSISYEADAWTIGGSPVTVRSVVRFDLSSIPSNAKIISARLSLFSNPTPMNGDLVNANSGPDNSLFIQQIISSWDSTVKFQNQPATDPNSQILIPTTNQSFLDLIDIDVTSMVQSMVSTGNYGFKLRLQNENYYNSRQFASSKHSDASKHPKLVIEWGY
jgi:hypothetical protein